MLISVVVAIYGVEKYLTKCLNSILSQHFNDYELILVDDGSKDNCPAICDDFAVRFKNIKVIHKQNGGIISARKEGLRLTKGEYIFFMDGDDYLREGFFDNIVVSIKQNMPDIVAFDYTIFNEEGKEIEIFRNPPLGLYNKNRLEKEIIPYVFSSKPFFSFKINMSVWSKMIRREIAFKAHSIIPNNINMGEAVAFSSACFLNASRLEIISNCKYMYRINSESITHKYNDRMIESTCSLFEYINKTIEKSNILNKTQIEDYFVYMTFLVIDNELRLNSQKYGSIKEKLEKYREKCYEMFKYYRFIGYPLKYSFSCKCLKYNLFFLLYIVYKVKTLLYSYKNSCVVKSLIL